MHAAALSHARGLALGVLGAVAVVACQVHPEPVRAGDLPNRGLARLAGMKDVIFAYEVKPSCKLETETGLTLPENGWRPLGMNELAGKRLPVVDLDVHKREGSERIDWVALGLREGPQSTRWVRIVPTDDVDAAAAAWRCVLDPSEASRLAPRLTAKRVRLAVGSAACTQFPPLVGDPDDVSILPYDVHESLLVAAPELAGSQAREGATGAFLGIRLQSTHGDAALVLRADDFDRCFVAAGDDAQNAWTDAQNVAEWLDAPHPDPRAAPPASITGLRLATGVELSKCEHDGDGPAEHYQCVVPSLRVGSVVATSGVKVVELVRERSLDALHTYGGKLVPANDAAAYEVVVHPHVAFGLAAQLAQPLGASVLDAGKQVARASLGYRLLRPEDLSPLVAVATHTMELNVVYTLPPPETVETTRKRKFKTITRSAPNPALYRAMRDYARVRAALKDALQAGGLARDRQQVLEARLAAAKAKVESIPKEITVDADASFDWTGKFIRRRGTASMHVVVRSPEGVAELTTSVDVPFEVEDTEDVEDPAHGIKAKPARTPSQADVDRVVAAAVVDRLDDVLTQWMLLLDLGGAAPPSMSPGSRAWATAVARRAVSDRPVALLTDRLETRPDVLERPLVQVPVELPPGSESRCFVFTATALDRRGDANLIFGVPPAPGSKRFIEIGRDSRDDADAGLELCNLPAGSYALGVWSRRSTRSGFLVSVFESTSGVAREDDVRAAMAGSPRLPAGDEKPVLTVPPRR
jgi:hypothetical protein